MHKELKSIKEGDNDDDAAAAGELRPIDALAPLVAGGIDEANVVTKAELLRL